MKTIKNKSTASFWHRIAIIITILLFSNTVFAQEICNNGIDDDGNGQIDLNDTACRCNFIQLISNPSFEDMNCCPNSYTQMSCSKNWIQASSATSDYMNTCGFVFNAAIGAGLVPFPDGNGIVGCIFAPTWQEYVGQCLNAPLLKDTAYSLQLNIASTPIDAQGGVCNGGVINYSAVNITLWGDTSCSNLPFSGADCPPAPWFVLGTVNYNPINSWSTVIINFTPTVNVNAIMLGSPCSLPGDYTYGPCYPYFYFDKLNLSKNSGYVAPYITQAGAWCNNNVVLSVPNDTGTSYQWYYNGISLAGQTTSTLNVSGNSYSPGMYQLIMTSNGTGLCSEDYSEVVAAPVSNAGNDTTVCVGDTIHLWGNNSMSGGITNYLWSGPNGFTSTLQNASITNAQVVAQGDYILTVANSSGCSSTDTVHVTVNTCGTLLNQSQHFNSLTIYPNPGNGQIVISNTQIINEVRIVNALGQIVYESKPRSQKVNFELGNPGVYFVIIKTDSQSITRKLIVN